MRRFALVLLFSLVPFIAQAASCSDDGYTVVFVNGVFDSKEQADEDRTALRDKLGFNINNQSINYTVGYNQTHLAGAADVVDSYFPSFDNFDLQTILMQMHDEVQTRKLLIVGHSEGAIYANKIYEYLVAHGEPKDSVAVYAVATPDSYVAGGGRYANFALDKVLVGLQTAKYKLLPYNLNSIDYINSNGENADTKWWHSFANTYLPLFANQITSDINTELWLLRSEPGSATDGCFDAPQVTPAYAFTQGAYASADPLATAGKIAAVGSYQVASAVVGTVGGLAAGAWGAVAGVFGGQTTSTTPTNNRGATDAVFALLHSLNLSSLNAQDVDNLQQGKDVGAAAVLALVPDQAPAPQGKVLGAMAPPKPAVPLIPQPSIVAPIPGGGASGAVSPAESAGTGPADDVATSTDATSTPEISPPPTPEPVLSFTNWSAPNLFNLEYCGLMQHYVDVSWAPVPGAASYALYSIDNRGSEFYMPTTSTSYPEYFFYSGINGNSIETFIGVHALDAGGAIIGSSSALLPDAMPNRVPPFVVSIDPPYGSIGVATTTQPSVTFNEPLDPATATGQYFSLTQVFYPFGGTSVDFTPVLSDDGLTLTFVPTAPLLPGASFDLSGSCFVRDLYGNHLDGMVLSGGTSHLTAYFTTAAEATSTQ